MALSQRAVLAKNEVILGVDCGDDNSAFSCFLFFLRGEEGKGKDGVADCC